jgi:hypothetical protein
VPGAGAGNLETVTAQDVYKFSISSSSTLQIDVSACQSTAIYWQLINADTGAVVRSAVSCSSTNVPNVPAGNYRISVTVSHCAGAYKFAVRGS